jgi:hypothetical protein
MRWRSIRYRLFWAAYDRRKAREQWHSWFAWRPVRVEMDGVWLETVERRYFDCAFYRSPWEYRLPAELRRARAPP